MNDKTRIDKPIILITMGDPAGIGPEIIVKALPNINDDYCPVVIGDRNALTSAAGKSGFDINGVNVVKRAEKANFSADKVNFVPVSVAGLGTLVPGKHNKKTGKASIAYLETAVNAILMNEADALVTGPLSKKAINEAGFYYNGHTDFFAERTNTSKYAMCFYTDNLKVALVSDHIPVRKIHTRIKLARVLRTIYLLDEFIRNLEGVRPKLAVLGLNPHAGESGLIGAEELNEIIPAINTANERGLNVAGPLTPEIGFRETIAGEYDGVVAMYHDQGIIPFKLIAPYDSVNVTLGLPFVRTSVGHGTGYDIAGDGTAKENSLIKAIKLAGDLVRPGRKPL
ncbi:MAG: 4-hydroxythreonine-4-phosphate dehydrogenase PdxA [Candidatus Coatesbacteria bacterium]|nr:MAG: 4-hydroxythreonine-4-phosphate dehydrogenase PdxA [Candidatus Coatesbacteria bacterium]